MAFLAGILFLVLGTVMVSGQLPPNPLFGVRLRWSLADPVVWYGSNRLGGALLWIWGGCLLLAGDDVNRQLLALVLPLPCWLTTVLLHAAWSYRSRHGSLIVPSGDDSRERAPWPPSLLLPFLLVLGGAAVSLVLGESGSSFVPLAFRWDGSVTRFGPPSALWTLHGLAFVLLAGLGSVQRRLHGREGGGCEGAFYLFLVAMVLLPESLILLAELMGRGRLAGPWPVLGPVLAFLCLAVARLFVVLRRLPSGAGARE